MMNRKFALLWTVPLVLGFSSAWADDHHGETDENASFGAQIAAEAQAGGVDGQSVADRARALGGAEVTIDLMDDDDDLVTNEVELPEPPARAAFGQSVAERARNGEVNGRDIADEARDLADAAQDAAEGRGRAEDLPADVPGRPDLPDHVPTPPRD